MNLTQILDVVEGLLVASEHPDIVAVERYGTEGEPWGPSVEKSRARSITGVQVRYQSSAKASLWGAVWPGETPIPLPEQMPEPKRRSERLAVFVVQLLDFARPEVFRSWQMVTLPGIGLETEQGKTAGGISLVCADGTRMLLRSTATGVTIGQEPEVEQFPDYAIPERVKSWQRITATAQSAGPR